MTIERTEEEEKDKSMNAVFIVDGHEAKGVVNFITETQQRNESRSNRLKFN